MKIVEYKEQLKNKDSVDQLWDKLALEVNKIGPPHYIGSAWRKKWSDHKSNKNRKRPMSDQTANIESSQCNLNFVYSTQLYLHIFIYI